MKLESMKEEATQKALEKNRNEYQNYLNLELERREHEREKRHSLKKLIRQERQGAISLLKRSLHSSFRQSGRWKHRKVEEE